MVEETPMPAEMPPNLVTPGDDWEGAPQAATKRWPWSKPKVATKPTRKDRREFRRAHKATE